MANLNPLAGKIVGQVTTNLLNEFNPYLDRLETYQQVLGALKRGEITLDQVQQMEDMTLRVMPAPPVAGCNQDMSASMTQLAESKNGKKEESVGAANNG
tara:strand:- start:9 stop:305 length:297 start_codon:yes stop_codon:yes gene_type:complete